METENEQIIKFISKNKKISSQNVADMFSISRQAAHKKISQLVQTGELIKAGKTRAVVYMLPGIFNASKNGVVLNLKNKNLKEHEVFEEISRNLVSLKELSENVKSIFNYAFSEMLNNAIEHSGSDQIEVKVNIIDGLLFFSIRDYGVGVFRNIMKKFKLNSETEAIAELMKGKTTTAPKAHSGEGIFFTSKIADTFSLDSFGFELLVVNTVPDLFVRAVSHLKKGTLVYFVISTASKKHLIDLFHEFESKDGEHDFDKTQIRVKLYVYGTIHVSRSQARRILAHIPERFKHMVLDFDQVPSVGQAFADEIFRVFQNAHPEIKIEVINANDAVAFMIHRSKAK